MLVHGSCHCGQIRYEGELDPETVGICHCSDCQMLTGSAYRVSAPAPAATLRFLAGEPKTYVKTADSGAKRLHGFCGSCGTPVYACAAVDAPPFYSLRIGCLAERTVLAPKRRIWCRSALPWAGSIDGLPGVEGQS